jgi:hypothetical protein
LNTKTKKSEDLTSDGTHRNVPETWDGGEGRELLQMRDFSSEFSYSLYEE